MITGQQKQLQNPLAVKLLSDAEVEAKLSNGKIEVNLDLCDNKRQVTSKLDSSVNIHQNAHTNDGFSSHKDQTVGVGEL